MPSSDGVYAVELRAVAHTREGLRLTPPPPPEINPVCAIDYEVRQRDVR